MATWDIAKMYVTRVPLYLDPDGFLRLDLAICKVRSKRGRCCGWKKKKEMKTQARPVPVQLAKWEDPSQPVYRFRVSSPKTVSIKANLIYTNSQVKEQLCSFAGSLCEGENILVRNAEGVICGPELRVFIVSTGKNRPVHLQNCVPRDALTVSGWMKNVTTRNEWLDLTKVWKPGWPCEDDELPVGYELASLVEQELKDDCVIFFNTLFPRTGSLAYRQIAQYYERSCRVMDGMKSQTSGSFLKHLHYAQSHTHASTHSIGSASHEDDDEFDDKNPIADTRKRIQFLKRLFLFVAYTGVTLHRDDDDPGTPWPYPIASIFGHGGRLLIRLEDVNPAQFLHFLINGATTSSASSSSSYPLAPFKRRIAATHQVEVDYKTGSLVERKLSVTNLQEVVTNVSDGIQGRHLGLDIPLGGTGNVAPVPGGKHYVGFFGEPVQLIPGRVPDVSQTMQLGHVYARIDDFGEVGQAVSPRRANTIACLDDVIVESTTDGTGSSSPATPGSPTARARSRQRARLRSDPLLHICRSTVEVEWLRDASTEGAILPPPPTVSALRALVEVKLKAEAFLWHELEGSIDKAVEKLHANLRAPGVGFDLANRDGRLVLLSRRAIAWVEHGGKILSSSSDCTTACVSEAEIPDTSTGMSKLDKAAFQRPLQKMAAKTPPKRATMRMMFRKSIHGGMNPEKDGEREFFDRPGFKPLKICISGQGIDRVKHEVFRATGISEKDLEVDNVVVVEDDDVPSEYPGLAIREEVTLCTLNATASALSAIPFELSFVVLGGPHPLEMEKSMFDTKTAQQWADALPDICDNIQPPSWRALCFLLDAADSMVPMVKQLYEQLQYASTVLRRKNKKLTLHRKVMYVRLRFEGYVLVESPPFANGADRNPSSDSLIFIEVRNDGSLEAMKVMSERFNVPLPVLRASVERTNREPIPLDDVESRLVFNEFSKSHDVVKVVTSSVVTYEITDQAPFRNLGLPMAKSAITHASLEKPFIVKQTTPSGIHAQQFRWVGEELHCERVVGFPKRHKTTTPMGGRRRVLCAEEQEELQQAFQKKRIASLLVGIEGCAPGKKNPLCGESHDASGKSSHVSACGNRKWRAYKINSLVDPFPIACNGMRVSCRPKQFTDFQAVCELLMESTEDFASSNSTSMGDTLASRPRRRSELNKREDAREIFRAILCDNALGARSVIDSTITDKTEKKVEMPKTMDTSATTSRRRMSSFI